jgi:hypothetical protein
MNHRITGIAFIFVPLAFNLVFFALGSAFNYPDILREPTADILQQFVAGGADLISLWYLFALTALLAIPLALLIQGVFQSEHPQLSQAAMIVGVLSGLVQGIGLLRWVFLVPGLATTYLDPAAEPALRAAAVVVFEAGHHFFGVAIGEHLGYFFTGSWTILLSVMMFRSTTFRPWLGIIGISAAMGILAGLLEPAGWDLAGLINAISYIVWAFWLMLTGIILLVRPSAPHSATRAPSGMGVPSASSEH